MLQGSASTLLNLSSFDFFGNAQAPAVKNAAKEALEKYGCGSCGPRGFYGTIDVHLEFEAKIAKFMGTEVGLLLSCFPLQVAYIHAPLTLVFWLNRKRFATRMVHHLCLLKSRLSQRRATSVSWTKRVASLS